MSTIHVPDTSLSARLNRRVIPFRAQKNIKFKLDKPIVSFTFDDCPKSVVENAIPMFDREHWKVTLYMAMGLCETTNHLGLHMSQSDVKAAHKSGHEIADHTHDHLDATTVSVQEFERNIDKNQESLNELDIPPSETFAYPYGQLNLATKKVIGQKFKGARGITSRVNAHNVDLNQISSNRLYSGKSYHKLIAEILELKKTAGWMTIYTHDVRDTPSDFGCRPEQLEAVIAAVKNSGAEVMTIANAIKYLETNNDK